MQYNAYSMIYIIEAKTFLNKNAIIFKTDTRILGCYDC